MQVFLLLILHNIKPIEHVSSTIMEICYLLYFFIIDSTCGCGSSDCSRDESHCLDLTWWKKATGVPRNDNGIMHNTRVALPKHGLEQGICWWRVCRETLQGKKKKTTNYRSTCCSGAFVNCWTYLCRLGSTIQSIIYSYIWHPWWW